MINEDKEEEGRYHYDSERGIWKGRYCCVNFERALDSGLVTIDHKSERVIIPIADRGQQFQDFSTFRAPWSSNELYIFCCPWCGTPLQWEIYFDNPHNRQDWEQ